VYILGGYAHLQTKLELSHYRESLRKSCTAVHELSHKAHQPGTKHLYEAVRILDQRCDAVARLANSQLRAMGSNNQWIMNQLGIHHNPFQATRRKHSERAPNLKKNTIRKDATPTTTTASPRAGRSASDEGEDDPSMEEPYSLHIPEFVTLRVGRRLEYWPSFMDEAYVAYADQLRLPGEVCSSTDLFLKPEAVTLEDLDCDMIVLPEIYLESSRYYNPLFGGAVNMTKFRLTGRLDVLRYVLPVEWRSEEQLIGC